MNLPQAHGNITRPIFSYCNRWKGGGEFVGLSGSAAGQSVDFCAAIIYNDSLCVFFQGISPSVASLFGEKAHITKHYVLIALSCFFSGASAVRWWRLECKRLFCLCKKCDRKKQRSVDCAEATKKTVQAMRYEWWGFFVAGDCPAELPVMNFQAKPNLWFW